MFDRVIVGFDGSERARDALVLADALTSADGEVIVCSVHHFDALSARIDPTEPRLGRDAAQHAVADAEEALKGGAKVTPMSVAGAGAARTLDRVAAEKNAELVVLGSSHRGTLGRVLLGSVGTETIHASRFAAVAIAPVGFHRRHRDGALGRVAVAYDVAEPVCGAVPAGVALCEQTGAELLIVAVAEDCTVADLARATMPYAQVTEARLAAAEQALETALAGLPPGVSARSEVRDGDPAEQLLGITRDADLLVLGSHGRGLVSRLVMGSVCDAVVRAAECAVLVVPSTGIPDAVEFERRRARRDVSEDVAALSASRAAPLRAQNAGG